MDQESFLCSTNPQPNCGMLLYLWCKVSKLQSTFESNLKNTILEVTISQTLHYCTLKVLIFSKQHATISAWDLVWPLVRVLRNSPNLDGLVRILERASPLMNHWRIWDRLPKEDDWRLPLCSGCYYLEWKISWNHIFIYCCHWEIFCKVDLRNCTFHSKTTYFRLIKPLKFT